MIPLISPLESGIQLVQLQEILLHVFLGLAKQVTGRGVRMGGKVGEDEVGMSEQEQVSLLIIPFPFVDFGLAKYGQRG